MGRRHTRKRNKTLTIGIVLPYLKARGPERQSFYLIKGLQRNNFKVMIFNIQGWGNSEIFEKTGVEIVNIGPPLFEGKKRVSRIRLFKLAYQVKKYQCDCLIGRHGLAAQMTGFASRINRIPSIVVFSSKIRKTGYTDIKSSFKRNIKLLRFLYKRGFANYFVTVSSEGGNNLISNFPNLSNRALTIQNGINIDEIYEQLASTPKIEKSKRFQLCYAGSLELARKGMDTLIDAMHDLINEKNLTDIELLLIGSGEDEEEIKQCVEEKGLKKFVIFAGEQKNPFPLIKSSDLFILPSRREGLPNALLEAMALEVCSIAFDCETGPKEIITNNKNGVLVSSNTSKELVDSIIRLKRDSSLRKKLALSGRKTVQEKFSYEEMISGYMKLIKNILDIE